jgi:hypothetical protein
MVTFIGDIVDALDAINPNILLAVGLTILVSAGVMIYKRLRR